MYNARMGVEVIPRLAYEDFRQLPDDGKRYELIQGRVHLSPAPSIKHQTQPVRSSGSPCGLADGPTGEDGGGLQGNKYLVDSVFAGRQTFTSTLFPGWEIALDELFRFPVRH